MRTAEEILLEIFNPSPQDYQTWREDLQLTITLNPSLEFIEQAINQARKEAIEECAEKAEIELLSDCTGEFQVDKQSILKLIDQIK